MLRKWILLLALACQGTAHAAVPETPRFRLLGVAEGMPSSSVNALTRDRDGYLWIATIDGLARYDGVGFRVWRHVPGDPGALPGNIVQALHVDAEDRVWVATEFGGLSVLDRERTGFRHYRQATHPRIGSDDTWAIASRGDDLWFGTGGGGLHRLDANTGTITRWTAESGGLPSDTILALAFDSAGALWIGTDAGLARFDDEHIEQVALPGEAGTPLVYSLTSDAQELWVGTDAGVFHRRHGGGWMSPAWSPMFERPNALTSIVRDRDGALWIGSQRGLWRAMPGATPAPVATGGPGIAKAVQSLLLQDDGALWAPVAGAGVGFLRSDWRRVAQFARAPEGLSAQLYPALARARSGGVWLGGGDGSVERLDANGAVMRLGDAERARLKDLRILAIAEDPAGRLWLGHRRGLLRIAGGVVDEWTAGDAVDPVPGGQIDLLRIAPDGKLWLSTQGGGVQRRDPASGRVLAQAVVGNDAGIGAGDTEALDFEPDGTPWIAGGSGLARWDRLQARFIAVTPMGASRVHAFAFEGIDRLWLHRITGLERYQRHGTTWRRTATITPARGLPAVESAALQIDGSGRVWLSTPRGLYRWDPRRRTLRRFGVQHGLGSQEFVDRALALTDAGTIAASTANGAVVLVDARSVDTHPSTPQLRVDSFAVRRHGQWQDWPRRRAIELAPADHEFRVRTRLLAYDEPSANRYWTRLEGFDRDWVAQGTSGERVFTSLVTGKYTLRVRAVDAAGNAAREQQLHFRVLPPWWRDGWAKAAAMILGMLAVAWSKYAYEARINRQHAVRLTEQRHALAEQASQAKTRFLATLGHEVRTPMTGVLGMTELLLGTPLEARQRDYAESIRNAGQHLLRLVNDTLDLARIEADKLQLEAIPFDLRALLQEVCRMLAPLAQAKGLQFNCDVGDDLPHGVRGDAHRVRQILLNLGSNAIKFTEHGGVTLRATALPAHGVRIEVADTGPGLDAAQQLRLFQRFEQADGARTAARYGGSGLGLAICRELAIAMGGTIGVDSVPGHGACFHVELPLPVAEPATARTDEARERPAAHRILLVEDDPVVADAVRGLLEAQGHFVGHAPHGLAALSALQTMRHDLAFVDLDLPGIDGFALARLLREQGHALPLIAITARADKDAEALALAAGMDGFLRKPVNGRLLQQAIAATSVGGDPRLIVA